MESVSLAMVVEELLDVARASSSGRGARTIHGGALRQTVLALVAGRGLDEHESPGEATLQVLAGRVRLRATDQSWEGAAGDFLVIPRSRHGLDALEDSAVLLTVALPAASGREPSARAEHDEHHAEQAQPGSLHRRPAGPASDPLR